MRTRHRRLGAALAARLASALAAVTLAVTAGCATDRIAAVATPPSPTSVAATPLNFHLGGPAEFALGLAPRPSSRAGGPGGPSFTLVGGVHDVPETWNVYSVAIISNKTDPTASSNGVVTGATTQIVGGAYTGSAVSSTEVVNLGSGVPIELSPRCSLQSSVCSWRHAYTVYCNNQAASLQVTSTHVAYFVDAIRTQPSSGTDNCAPTSSSSSGGDTGGGGGGGCEQYVVEESDDGGVSWYTIDAFEVC